MKLEIDIDADKLADAVVQMYKAELRNQIMQAIRPKIRNWAFESGLNEEIKKYMDKKAPALVDKVFENYDHIRENAERTITNSMAQRVARAAKRMEGL